MATVLGKSTVSIARCQGGTLSACLLSLCSAGAGGLGAAFPRVLLSHCGGLLPVRGTHVKLGGKETQGRTVVPLTAASRCVHRWELSSSVTFGPFLSVAFFPAPRMATPTAARPPRSVRVVANLGMSSSRPAACRPRHPCLESIPPERPTGTPLSPAERRWGLGRGQHRASCPQHHCVLSTAPHMC